MTSAPAVLEVERLTTDYGPVRAVDGVSLTVHGGSVTAVLGANGAGKTSLLRTISGLERASAGQVRLDGEGLLGVAVEDIVRRGLAHVPEGRGVIAELSTEENLRLGGLWRGADGAALEEVVRRCFRRCESAAPSSPRRCPAASVRCSRSVAR